MVRLIVFGALALAAATPAVAGELVGGLYVHDVDTPFTKSGIEGGVDVQLGYRWDPLMSAKGPQPYVFVAGNTAGKTHYAAAGLSFKFGSKVFVRPGLGIAVHTGSTREYTRPGADEIDFGSRVLFEPELGVGVRITDRATVEASWVHMSHAQVFSSQNPGIDNIGARLSWKL